MIFDFEPYQNLTSFAVLTTLRLRANKITTSVNVGSYGVLMRTAMEFEKIL